MQLNFASTCVAVALLAALQVSNAATAAASAAGIEGLVLDEYELSKVISNIHTNRDLQQNIPCGVTLSVMTPDIIRATISGLFAQVNAGGIEEAGTILTDIFPKLEFAVEMRKICASCESEGLEKLDPYCDSSAYGYDVTHSGYVFLPATINDDGSSSIIKATKLDTFATFRPLMRRHIDGFFINTNPPLTIFNIMAASYGLASMNFDMTGYGDSSSLVPSPVQRVSVGTASLPIFHKVQSMIQEETRGRTKLSDKISFYGYSEGGYSSIAAADAFENSGFKIEHVYAGGAPVKVASWAIMGVLRAINTGTSTIFDRLNAALVSLPLSSTRPGVANYLAGQDALAGDATLWLQMYTDDTVPQGDNEAYLAWIKEKYGEVVSLPVYNSNVLLNLFQDALDSNDTNPCAVDKRKPGINDKLCEALMDQDLTEIVENADYNIDFCHAVEDNLVVIENIPEGYPIKYEIPYADHGSAVLPCLIKMFSSTEFEKPKMRKSSKGSKGSKSSKGLKVSKGSKGSRRKVK